MSGALLLSAAARGFAVGGFSCFVDFLCHNSDPLIFSDLFAASGVSFSAGRQSYKTAALPSILSESRAKKRAAPVHSDGRRPKASVSGGTFAVF
jgi:hypothetical protein